MIQDKALLLTPEELNVALEPFNLRRRWKIVRGADKAMLQAQLDKAKPLIERELLSQEGVKASFDSMIKREVEETLKEVNALIDKYIGDGEYNVYVPERGTIRGISDDLGYVWKALKQELEALLQGKMPEAVEVTK